MYLAILRNLGTVLAFLAFIAICVWTYRYKRREEFSEAANLPFADEINFASETNAVSSEEHSS